MVERKEYLDQLWAWKDEQQIKVVTGIRRCGKSVLLEQYQQRLLANGVTPEQIISINFENLDYEPLKDYMKLYNYLKERLCADKMTYIFLDEVQEVPSFEKVVDSLYIRDHVDVYITGSNAYILSSELATLLSGRYKEIKMLPLSNAARTTELSAKTLSKLKSNSSPVAKLPFSNIIEIELKLVSAIRETFAVDSTNSLSTSKELANSTSLVPFNSI